ncbi:MAG: zf-HC2 domain-containing protein [Gammaproteobacteria bacterium]|nr:zf-HC2 domain-containing protein [Gammaproteobacteria bacterium]
MSNTLDTNPEHEAVFELLPWWVNNTLTTEEHSRVREHVENCALCQQEAETLGHQTTVLSMDSDAAYANTSVESQLNSVLQRIDSDPQSHDSIQSVKQPSLYQRLLRQLVAEAPLRWAAVAATGLLVFILGVQLWSVETADDYTVLSSGVGSAETLQISVGFLASVSSEEAEQVLGEFVEDWNYPVTTRQVANSRYVIEYDDSISVPEVHAIYSELENHPWIEHVELLP